MGTITRPGNVICAAEAKDASDIANIYNHYVSKMVNTFEKDEVTAAAIALQIEEVQSKALP
jgi:L-amino acid N-acyltransferase YncA